jgi:hypothetical protein
MAKLSITENDIPTPVELTQDQIRQIAADFKPPRKGFSLPRIAFFGYFKHLCMTDQRHLCKYLGFEYMADIPFGATNEDQMSLIVNKMREITDYTALVVIGDAYEQHDGFYTELYRRYKPKASDKTPRQPIIIEQNVPVIMESTLIKVHPDYPVIDHKTCWRGLNDVEFLEAIRKKD